MNYIFQILLLDCQPAIGDTGYATFIRRPSLSLLELEGELPLGNALQALAASTFPSECTLANLDDSHQPTRSGTQV